MFDVDRRLHSIAVRQKGIVTVLAALGAGITMREIERRIEAGVLIRIHEGIYRHAAVPYTQQLRDLAAVLACGPDAVLSHRSAAARSRWPDVRRARPEVTSPHKDLPRVEGVTLHRSLRLPKIEIMVRDGIPMTTPGRTAMDLCAVLPRQVTEEIIHGAKIMKLVDPREVFATLERSGGRGCPGTADLRQIALGFDDLEGLESMLELEVARQLERARIPTPVRQHELVCTDGRRVRFDFALPDLRYALDADGKRWHDTPKRKKRDRDRHESIVDSGWVHDTCGWADVHNAPSDFRHGIETTIAGLLVATAA